MRPWAPTALQRIFVSPFRLNWSLSSSEIGDRYERGEAREREKAVRPWEGKKGLREGERDGPSNDQTMTGKSRDFKLGAFYLPTYQAIVLKLDPHLARYRVTPSMTLIWKLQRLILKFEK